MKIGYCSKDLSLACDMKRLGFDYYEFGLYEISTYDKNKLTEMRKTVADAGLEVGACNGFFPADLPVVGENVDASRISEYVKRAIYASNLVGCDTLVLGSGKSRNIPDGFSKERADDQLCEMFELVNREAAANGINIAIEPLRAEETNSINTVRQGYDLCKRLSLSNVHLLADLFHVGSETDIDKAFEDISGYGDELIHTHIARPVTRKMPFIGDGYDYSAFFGALKKAGYKGNMSIEAGSDDRFGTAEKALEAAIKCIRSYL